MINIKKYLIFFGLEKISEEKLGVPWCRAHSLHTCYPANSACELCAAMLTTSTVSMDRAPACCGEVKKKSDGMIRYHIQCLS